MRTITVNGTGSAIADSLFTGVDFTSPEFRSYCSKVPGDGGLEPGKLVLTEDFEAFTGKPADQTNLIITEKGEAEITVDDLKIAQFIYLLLNNAEIRDVIDTVARKAVLILGRFTPERKAILDGLRVALREHNYAPILFDFDKPASRDVTETVRQQVSGLRLIVLKSSSYNSAFGGDPAPSVVKQLKIEYTIDGKPGEGTFAENA